MIWLRRIKQGANMLQSEELSRSQVVEREEMVGKHTQYVVVQ